MPDTKQSQDSHLVVTRGSEAFAAFLKKNDITLEIASSALGVADPTVLEWRRGGKRPRAEHRIKIETWTGGTVKASWWMTDAERKALHVEPYEPIRNS